MTNKAVLSTLKSFASPQKTKNLTRFFKTSKGEYGEGDTFWGLTVPQVRQVAKQYKELPLSEIVLLLQNTAHEARQCALFIMVDQFKKNPKKIFTMYIRHTAYINNWDLVDASAGYIVGAYLDGKEKTLLTKFAKSKNIWERRIAIIATFYYIYQRQPEETLRIAEILIHDSHDLIQKAVGWMLREVGKRCSREVEEAFLKKHAATMPRTALRYAIEHFPKEKRVYYLGIKQTTR